MTRIVFLLLLIVTPTLITASTKAQTFSQADIRKVPQALVIGGYEVGRIDGKFVNKTATAIRHYQSDWQLEETGKISAELIARLMRKHEATMPREQKAENQDCVLDNPLPGARQTLTITGSCAGGKLNGKAKTVWRQMHLGQWKESGYEGEYRDGKRHGQGVYTWTTGKRYEGEFRNGKKHGRGVYIYKNGRREDRHWNNGCTAGKKTSRAIGKSVKSCGF